MLIWTATALAGTLAISPKEQDALTEACVGGDVTACTAMATAAERRWAWSFYQDGMGAGRGSPSRWFQATAFRERACELGDATSCRWAARASHRDVERVACLQGDNTSCRRLGLLERREVCEAVHVGGDAHSSCVGPPGFLGVYPSTWTRPEVFYWGVVDLTTGQWTDGAGKTSAVFRDVDVPLVRDEDAVVARLKTVDGTVELRFEGAEMELTTIQDAPSATRRVVPGMLGELHTERIASSPDGTWWLAGQDRHGPSDELLVTGPDGTVVRTLRVDLQRHGAPPSIDNAGRLAVGGWVLAIDEQVQWSPVPPRDNSIDDLIPLRGRTRYVDRAPELPRAQVQIVDAVGRVVRETRTDRFGRYAFWARGAFPLTATIRGTEGQKRVTLESIDGQVGPRTTEVELLSSAPLSVQIKDCAGAPLPYSDAFASWSEPAILESMSAFERIAPAKLHYGDQEVNLRVRADHDSGIAKVRMKECRVTWDRDDPTHRDVYAHVMGSPMPAGSGPHLDLLTEPGERLDLVQTGGGWAEATTTYLADQRMDVALAHLETRRIRVVDEVGAGVAGVEVQLRLARSSSSGAVRTGLDGWATVPALAEATVRAAGWPEANEPEDGRKSPASAHALTVDPAWSPPGRRLPPQRSANGAVQVGAAIPSGPGILPFDTRRWARAQRARWHVSYGWAEITDMDVELSRAHPFPILVRFEDGALVEASDQTCHLANWHSCPGVLFPKPDPVPEAWPEPGDLTGQWKGLRQIHLEAAISDAAEWRDLPPSVWAHRALAIEEPLGRWWRWQLLNGIEPAGRLVPSVQGSSLFSDTPVWIDSDNVVIVEADNGLGRAMTRTRP